MNEKKPETLYEAALFIAKKAYADPEYMKRVESDTKKVVEEVLNVELPDALKLNLLKSTPEQLYLVLPPNPEELSDESLEKVAGGIGIGIPFAAGLAQFSPEVEEILKVRK